MKPFACVSGGRRAPRRILLIDSVDAEDATVAVTFLLGFGIKLERGRGRGRGRGRKRKTDRDTERKRLWLTRNKAWRTKQIADIMRWVAVYCTWNDLIDTLRRCRRPWTPSPASFSRLSSFPWTLNDSPIKGNINNKGHSAVIIAAMLIIISWQRYEPVNLLTFCNSFNNSVEIIAIIIDLYHHELQRAN